MDERLREDIRLLRTGETYRSMGIYPLTATVSGRAADDLFERALAALDALAAENAHLREDLAGEREVSAEYLAGLRNEGLA